MAAADIIPQYAEADFIHAGFSSTLLLHFQSRNIHVRRKGSCSPVVWLNGLKKQQQGRVIVICDERTHVPSVLQPHFSCIVIHHRGRKEDAPAARRCAEVLQPQHKHKDVSPVLFEEPPTLSLSTGGVNLEKCCQQDAARLQESRSMFEFEFPFSCMNFRGLVARLDPSWRFV